MPDAGLTLRSKGIGAYTLRMNRSESGYADVILEALDGATTREVGF